MFIHISQYNDILLPPPNGENYVLISVGSSVWLFVYVFYLPPFHISIFARYSCTFRFYRRNLHAFCWQDVTWMSWNLWLKLHSHSTLHDTTDSQMSPQPRLSLGCGDILESVVFTDMRNGTDIITFIWYDYQSLKYPESSWTVNKEYHLKIQPHNRNCIES